MPMRSQTACAPWPFIATAAFIISVSAACSKAPEPPPANPPATTPAPAAPPAATPPAATPPTTTPPPVVQQPTPPAKSDQPMQAKDADVVIKDMESQQPVAVRVGQTVGILSSESPNSWQVDADPDLLQLVSPPQSQMSKPGNRGWVWRAVKNGTAEIVLVSRAPCPNPPCGENPAKFTVTLEITARK